MAVSVSLGPRLQLVASFVPEGARLGDIGTDHAYLPIYLWEMGRIERAVAVDVHEGPYRSACSAIKSRGLTATIDVRFGDGLKPIQAGEVDTLTLAGMGGNTMLEIFAARPDIMIQVTDLVVQPQGAEGKVRQTLLEAGWKMKREEYVAEEGRLYVVMHFSRREGYSLADLQRKVQKWQVRVLASLGDQGENVKEGTDYDSKLVGELSSYSAEHKSAFEEDKNSWEGMKSILARWIWELGPLSLDHPGQELKEVLLEQIKTLERTIGEMQKSQQERVQKRIQEYILTIKLLEELGKCLFPLV